MEYWNIFVIVTQMINSQNSEGYYYYYYYYYYYFAMIEIISVNSLTVNAFYRDYLSCRQWAMTALKVKMTLWYYLCNRCVSPLMLHVRIPLRERCTTLCDKVCQWFAASRWLPPCPPVSSTNETDRHDITEILLKVVLSTIKQDVVICRPT